ncbi:MAG: phosphodiester glycosidase family protein [Candidatus Eremiobacteraeota bacterium]|nr:phosphodiester glycosidase family protein [Candidatus Eremiobacteraeota bacterium]
MLPALLLSALAATLAPPPPFPTILAQSYESAYVAPGVRRADYRLATASGPLAIEIVEVDLHEPTVRLDDVLATDHLVSPGETVSSMATRTRAVAGINGDYFDIGQTNQPLNMVVHDGSLLRTPSRRIVLEVSRDRRVRFENVRFSGTAKYATTTIPLTAINEWPPQGGASLITPAFGPIAGGTQGITFVALTPLGPLASVAGSYRVLGVYDATPGPLGATTLALGPAALAYGPQPSIGDTVEIAAQTDPPLQDVVAAIGGGPLLVADGKPVDDPNAPAPEERERRFPVAGAATTPDGRLLLVAVDGRQPSASIGLTRPEFAALMRGLGASAGMAFDSGGSATLVARILGEAVPRVLNAPSDGVERPVANGLFVYSDAPPGPPARLALRPERILALRGTTIPVAMSVTDEAGHLLSTLAGTTVRATTSTTLVERAGALSATLPVTVVDSVAHLSIEPGRPNPDPGGLVQLVVRASDPSGRTIYTNGVVRWNAERGTFLEPGTYRAATTDATVTAAAGGATAKSTVYVGRHTTTLKWFDPVGTVALNYDFSKAGSRIASLLGTYRLPGEPFAFSIEVDGDASGVGLRAAFLNRFGERTALTLAKNVDWRGWQTRSVALPPSLNPPVTLVALYAVNSLGGPPVRTAGTIRFRTPSVTLPGVGAP